jgi:hypothetical protein
MGRVKNDPKNDDPSHTILFGSGQRFVFSYERPEQVAPFSILNKFVDYLPHSILLYWFIMDGRWELHLFNRYKDKKKTMSIHAKSTNAVRDQITDFHENLTTYWLRRNDFMV